MNARASLPLLVLLSGCALRAQSPDDGEIAALDPFLVTAEEDSGYQATSTLAGTRIQTGLKDVGSALSVVNAQFLQDTRAALPSVPVTIIKKADALLIQFALATTIDKQETRNKELSSYLDSVEKAVSAVAGLRFEPREVYLASGDRKKSIIGRGGVITSFAHFVIFAELSPDQRPYQRIKQVREIIDDLHIDTATTKLIDGPVGLFVRRPSQYRGEILTKVFEDLESVKKGLGSEFEVLASGLAGGIRMRTCSESEVELWIDYSFTIRSIRELEARKRQ